MFLRFEVVLVLSHQTLHSVWYSLSLLWWQHFIASIKDQMFLSVNLFVYWQDDSKRTDFDDIFQERREMALSIFCRGFNIWGWFLLVMFLFCCPVMLNMRHQCIIIVINSVILTGKTENTIICCVVCYPLKCWGI